MLVIANLPNIPPSVKPSKKIPLSWHRTEGTDICRCIISRFRRYFFFFFSHSSQGISSSPRTIQAVSASRASGVSDRESE